MGAGGEAIIGALVEGMGTGEGGDLILLPILYVIYTYPAHIFFLFSFF